MDEIIVDITNESRRETALNMILDASRGKAWNFNDIMDSAYMVENYLKNGKEPVTVPILLEDNI